MGTAKLTGPAATGAARSGYDPAFFARLYAIEDRHFWFRSRNRVIGSLVRRVTAGLAPGYRVLEVGCGTGNTLRVVEQACPHGTVTGMDLFAEGLLFARSRTACPLVCGDMHAPPFDARFELIGLFDVLEHLPDDLQVLRDLHAMLAPGGVLLLTVPAHPSLWSYFDEASHHCRRYEAADLERKLTGAGYRVEYATEYMAGIFPLVWLGRRLSGLARRRSLDTSASGRDGADRARLLATDELRIIPGVNALLSLLLAPEAPLIARGRRLPIGSSIVAVARKSSLPAA
ncbi:MAG TPA: class I SAM-dependent methyltransferase [Bryobacterales bacterium]|nr:class I SAM-dependent methyltransferase [Bryobacterales bacterium]